MNEFTAILIVLLFFGLRFAVPALCIWGGCCVTGWLCDRWEAEAEAQKAPA